MSASNASQGALQAGGNTRAGQQVLSSNRHHLYESRQISEAMLADNSADHGGFQSHGARGPTASHPWRQLWRSQADFGRIPCRLSLLASRVGNQLEDCTCPRVPTAPAQGWKYLYQLAAPGSHEVPAIQRILQLDILQWRRSHWLMGQDGSPRETVCPIYESQL